MSSALPQTAPRPGEPPHVPVLDGIRGLAILLVLLDHNDVFAPISKLEGYLEYLGFWGSIGVDVFFVLSGFLITGILLEARESARYFRNFYARRVLRIFPLYYAVVALSLFVLPHFLPADKAARFGKIAGDEIYYWLYLQNFAMARAGDLRHGILDVTWSLAIEEQFYLVWPTVVLLCSAPTLKRVCAGLFVASFGFRVFSLYGLHLTPLSIYWLTPCRMDGLAAGAFLAVVAREPGGLRSLVGAARKVGPLAGLGALSLVLYECFFDQSPIGPGFGVPATLFAYTLLAVAFGAMLVLSVESPREGPLARIFSARFLRLFGKYSYGIYLFDLPIRGAIRDRLYGPHYKTPRFYFHTFHGSELPGQMIFYVLATVAPLLVAMASFHLYEKQFSKLKRFFPSAHPRPAPSPAAPSLQA